MPTYTYRCADCNHEYEAFQSMKDEPHKECPECSGAVERVIGAGAGILFKGSGFYVTDYKKGGAASPGSSSDSKSSGGSGSSASSSGSSSASSSASSSDSSSSGSSGSSSSSSSSGASGSSSSGSSGAQTKKS